LAYHYANSANTGKAVEYLHRAGVQAAQRSAHPQAVAHLSFSLELLKTLPESPARDRQELALQTALAPSLYVTRGWAAPEVEIVHNRAVDLSDRLGARSMQFPARWGLSIFYMLNAKYQQAISQAKELVALAEAAEDAGSLLEAHIASGRCSFWLGELKDARNHLEFAVSRYESQHAEIWHFYMGRPILASRACRI
jgi:hypothetical protein